MPSLRELQCAFAAGVFADDGRITAHILGGELSAAERLNIYRNNVFTSLGNALGDVFTTVRRLVGEDFFGLASRHYIRRHPSQSGNLHDFGQHFAAFLEGFAPASEHAYLADVARLDWARDRAFHAGACNAFPIERLAAVAPARQAALRFVLHPAVRLLSSRFPIARIWEANGDAAVPGEPIDLLSGGERLLINRPERTVTHQRLSAGEYRLLAALQAECAFGDACERALATEPGLELGRCLQAHVLLGTIVDFLDTTD